MIDTDFSAVPQTLARNRKVTLEVGQRNKTGEAESPACEVLSSSNQAQAQMPGSRSSHSADRADSCWKKSLVVRLQDQYRHRKQTDGDWNCWLTQSSQALEARWDSRAAGSLACSRTSNPGALACGCECSPLQNWASNTDPRCLSA